MIKKYKLNKILMLLNYLKNLVSKHSFKFNLQKTLIITLILLKLIINHPILRIVMIIVKDLKSAMMKFIL
jgi:hypothetical protein